MLIVHLARCRLSLASSAKSGLRLLFRAMPTPHPPPSSLPPLPHNTSGWLGLVPPHDTNTTPPVLPSLPLSHPPPLLPPHCKCQHRGSDPFCVRPTPHPTPQKGLQPFPSDANITSSLTSTDHPSPQTPLKGLGLASYDAQRHTRAPSPQTRKRQRRGSDSVRTRTPTPTSHPGSSQR